jgi:hypothetical protein
MKIDPRRYADATGSITAGTIGLKRSFTVFLQFDAIKDSRCSGCPDPGALTVGSNRDAGQLADTGTPLK